MEFLVEHFSIEIQENSPTDANIFVKAVADTEYQVKSQRLNSDFENILNRRESIRSLRPFGKDKLLSILYHSARVTNTALTETGFIKANRPFPSGGGRHPLEILVVTTGMLDMEDGLWYFDPFKLLVQKLKISSSLVDDIRRSAKTLLGYEDYPPAMVVSVAVLYRTLSRYKNGLGLIWRDSGCLLNLMSLVVLSHDLNSCQVGISKEFQYGSMLGLDDYATWITGGLAIGR